MDEIVVSPAEPKWLKSRLSAIYNVTTSKTLTEDRGVDIAWLGAADNWWGVQRKQLDDLIASVGDGRIQREVGQMNAATGVVMPHIIIEGQVRFTSEGVLIRDGQRFGQEFTRRQWRGLLWSLQKAGVAISYAPTGGDLVELVVDLYAWSQKARHTTIRGRPGAPATDWGTRGNREWARHLLQGFDGIGPEVADAILDVHGLPLAWTVTVDELMQVPGVGKVRAKKLLQGLAA